MKWFVFNPSRVLLILFFILVFLSAGCEKTPAVQTSSPVEETVVSDKTTDQPDAQAAPSALENPTSTPIYLPQVLGRNSPSPQQAVAWNGRIASAPEGSAYDDIFILNPPSSGESGIDTTSPELENQINALRDQEGLGQSVTLWGTVACGVPDHLGCSLLVTDLRIGQYAPISQPFEDWSGRIECNPSVQVDGGSCLHAFVLSGQFQVWYGVSSVDPQILAAFETVRRSGEEVRISGDLVAGVADLNGVQLQVERMEGLNFSLPVLDQPTSTPGLPQGCLLPSRLIIGRFGIVTSLQPLRIRAVPGTDKNGLILGNLPVGTILQILNGPVCLDGYNWWLVQSGDLVGWTAEGNFPNYWLEPYFQKPIEVSGWVGTIISLPGADSSGYCFATASSSTCFGLTTENPAIYNQFESLRDTGQTVVIYGFYNPALLPAQINVTGLELIDTY